MSQLYPKQGRVERDERKSADDQALLHGVKDVVSRRQ